VDEAIRRRLNLVPFTVTIPTAERDSGLPDNPLCQRSCRLNRIGTFGGADSRKWLDTDKRTKIG
jgi:phage/plasmid-associated DNA primase